MYRKLLVCILLLLSTIPIVAQYIGQPYWITKVPDAVGDRYYYRVTMAEADSYDLAYAKAFAMAILESSWKMGVTVDNTGTIESLTNNILEEVSVRPGKMRLPMNKVCEFREDVHTSKKIRLYILWQVAQSGNVDPKFETFNQCE